MMHKHQSQRTRILLIADTSLELTAAMFAVQMESQTHTLTGKKPGPYHGYIVHHKDLKTAKGRTLPAVHVYKRKSGVTVFEAQPQPLKAVP